MKKVIITLVVGFCGLVALGALLEASKSPEEKAAAAKASVERAAQQEIKGKAEKDYSSLKKLVAPARDLLTAAYLAHVKDKGASHVSCREAEVDKRFYIRCGVAYGSPETGNNGSLVLYAMNGKALRALDHIGESAAFQRGNGRPPVDTVELAGRF